MLLVIRVLLAMLGLWLASTLLFYARPRDSAPSFSVPPPVQQADGPALRLGVKVFLRLECAERFLKSAAAHFPQIPMTVAYDGTEDYIAETPRFPVGVQVLRLPFDSGAARGRNQILDTEKKLGTFAVALADSDTVLSEETRLDTLMLEVMRNTDADVVAAACPDSLSESFSSFEFSLTDESQLHIVPGKRNPDYSGEEYNGCFRVDFVKQCLVLIRSSSNARWDPYLKNNDHYDFFLQLRKDNKKVYYCPAAKVQHDSSCGDKYSERYGAFRSRWSFFLPYVMTKWNLTRLQTGRNKVYFP